MVPKSLIGPKYWHFLFSHQVCFRILYSSTIVPMRSPLGPSTASPENIVRTLTTRFWQVSHHIPAKPYLKITEDPNLTN